ncbi:MAG: sulfotransferase [Spirochaetales bacterium]|nr:sulfotransferase [Spirochaetales bacterium]
MKKIFPCLVNYFIRNIKITKSPIFIVGCGHSGTSLLLAILGSHSMLYAIPYESYLCFCSRIKAFIKRLDFRFLTIAAGKRRWIEKTPKHIYCIEKLFKIYPQAKILLIIRDGRDVACSIQDRNGSLASGINRWVKDNRAGEPFWEHENVYVLKYENIIEDFEETISGVLAFLGEHYEQEIREYYKIPKQFYSNKIKKPNTKFGKDHEQYRNWQINQPLLNNRGKFLRMTEQEKRLIKKHANKMLIKYKYINNNKW